MNHLKITTDGNIQIKEACISWFLSQIPFLYGPNLPSQKHYEYAFVFSLSVAFIWLALCIKSIIILRNDYSYGMYIYKWSVQQAIIALFAPPPLISLRKHISLHKTISHTLLTYCRETGANVQALSSRLICLRRCV